MMTNIQRVVKIMYQAGDWFSVPLRSSGFGIGIIARQGENGILFGYFFGPKSDQLPTFGQTMGLKPNKAILLARFGDLGLKQGQWSLIGRSPTWDASDWPMPSFVRRDIISGKLSLVTYDESNLVSEIRLEQVTRERCKEMPADGLYGYGAIEIKLTRLL
jgi:Immunity protein 26